MQIATMAERRQSPRRAVNRTVKLRLDSVAAPRDCLLADISTGGVQLHVSGFAVPDEFTLLMTGNGLHRECRYRVVWRRGDQIGAKSLGVVRRAGVAARP